MSQQKDYGEIFCTAVDEIIAQRIAGLSYDITKLCTIVDNSRKNEGRYVVSDGSTRFEAFAKENNYQNGNSVLVTIPNGDYNMQKTITGRVAAADTKPFNYTSPMDTMIKITNNIFDEGDALRTEGQLLANENNTSTIIGPIYSIDSSNDKFAGFTRLGITADFQSWLNGLDVVQGIYGLKALIYTDGLIRPGQEGEQVYELTFSSADMFGNPYQFESYFSQEKVFDISNINNIKRIEIYFYQNGEFRDGNNNYIAWQYDMPEIGSSKLANNLFVDNIKIYLGYEQGKFTDETLMLCTQDLLSYHYSRETNLKHITLRWIHKVSEGTFEMLDGEHLDTNKYEVRWFKYHPGHGEIDEYGGENWERVEPDSLNPFMFILSPDCELQTEDIKAVGLIKEQMVSPEGVVQDPNISDYYSNVLTFTNEEKVKDKTTYDAATALSIRFLDGTEGNYLIYDQNGKIINEGVGNAYQRTLEAMYKGSTIAPSLNQKLDYLEWWFPCEDNNEAFTMILQNENDNSGKASVEIKKWQGVDYKKYRYLPDADNILYTKFYYYIRNDWKASRSNNTIRCVVSINGQEYEAVEEMRFGKAGSNGTNTTFLIEFVNNQNAVIAKKGETLSVKARLYDADGRRVDFTQDQVGKIKWSWFKSSATAYMTIPENAVGQTVQITSNTDTIPTDNYFILQAEYQADDNSVKLTTYLPIPIKAQNCSHIEGAREVIYNHQGVISDTSYYSDAYVLYKYSEGKYVEIYEPNKWGIKVAEQSTAPLLKSYTPQLKKIMKGTNQYKGLAASQMYMAGANDKVCVYCTGYWSQPILIMQSKYDFAMLNAWEEGLTIDEKNGTILSTMLGAGRKNSDDNSFSGVLIGDIQGGTDLNDADTQTGVYGLHHGAISYALKEDGTATFGKAGHGQIRIDGKDSTIQSQSYYSGEYGMKIDLDNGIIDILGEDKSRITIQPESPYFTITSSSRHFDENNVSYFQPIINIGTADDYFIQSNNYTPQGSAGTKLNLSTGSFEVKDAYVRTYLGKKEDEYIDTNNQRQKENVYFQIAVPPLVNGAPGTAANSGTYQNKLLSIGEKNYYLQSINYLGLSFQTVEISNVTYNLYNKGLVAVTSDGENIRERSSDTSTSWRVKTFSDTVEEVEIYNSSGKKEKIRVTMLAKDHRAAYLAKLSPLYTQNQGSGMRLDLAKGIINGYDLMLKGTKKTDPSKTIIIDSSSSTTPLKIGDNFNVGWDGTLTCYKLNEISNVDNEQSYAINISDNFYVTKGGGAGGSGVRFSGSFGGYCSGTGVFSTLSVGKAGEGGGDGSGVTSLNGATTIGGKLTVPEKFTIGAKEVGMKSTEYVSTITDFKKTTVEAYTSLNKNSRMQLSVTGGGYAANPGAATSSGGQVTIKENTFVTGGTKTAVMTGVSFKVKSARAYILCSDHETSDSTKTAIKST